MVKKHFGPKYVLVGVRLSLWYKKDEQKQIYTYTPGP